MYNLSSLNCWLVVWNIFFFPIYWECHHPNWLSYFSEGFKPPTSNLSSLTRLNPIIQSSFPGIFLQPKKPHEIHTAVVRSNAAQVNCTWTLRAPPGQSFGAWNTQGVFLKATGTECGVVWNCLEMWPVLCDVISIYLFIHLFICWCVSWNIWNNKWD